MTLVYIALGSNLASPLEQVQAAIRALGDIPHSRVVNVSSFYRTPPLGPQDQPDYLNAAVALETTLAPDALLDHTQRIELQQGRVRKAERWGPRAACVPDLRDSGFPDCRSGGSRRPADPSCRRRSRER